MENDEPWSGVMWRSLKRVLQWKEGGPPTELIDKTGNTIEDPEKLTELLHDTFEEKVRKILEENEKYLEDTKSKKEGNKSLYKGTGRTFKFTQVDEKTVKEVIRALPRYLAWEMIV